MKKPHKCHPFIEAFRRGLSTPLPGEATPPPPPPRDAIHPCKVALQKSFRDALATMKPPKIRASKKANLTRKKQPRR
jgi:hypothetical protein